jgi:formylglycine-generating enzyme required for sulfatase activity/uncharacterized caspase-like protein
VRVHRIIAAAWLMLLSAVATAHADKRVALVIGNGDYRHADRLANPVNDAQEVRDALKKLGFDVVYGENLDLKALRRTIGLFAGRVEGADVALVYFAGHGATFGDTPYVVPVDAEFSDLSVVPYELVPVETLIGELRNAKGVRIAILDACRDNGAEGELKRQVAARGGVATRGLGPMKNPAGLIVAYATQYLSTAADVIVGTQGGPAPSARHSPFTTALLNNIATPGLDVKDMFYKVGSEVDAATGGRQRPEISISMYANYALAPAAGPAAPNAAVATPPGGGPAVPDVTQAWAAAQNTTSLAVLDEFIRQYGGTPVYGALARARREELADKEQAKEQAKNQVAVVVPARPDGADPCGGPVTVSFPSRCATPLTVLQERGLKPTDSFRECENCPAMVVLPAGAFTMGSPEAEEGRLDDEGPQHIVTVRKFAAGREHVTVDQFAAFVVETGYAASAKCWTSEGGKDRERADRSWRNPGFTQAGSHPAVCLRWDDAKAYADWLASKTGKPYRLLSEAEWEFAARGRLRPGVYPRFWFGNNDRDLCRYGNGADQKARDSLAVDTAHWPVAPCNDGHARTSPAESFQSNPFGLYDMTGNALQWTADCWHPDYGGAPADGSAWTTRRCRARVVRGASWNDSPMFHRAAHRSVLGGAYNYAGFRLARSLAP